MQNFLLSLAYVIVFVIIGIVFTLLVIASGIFTFFQLTQINEWEEIKNAVKAGRLLPEALKGGGGGVTERSRHRSVGTISCSSGC